jgi:hypothetical protein
MRPQVWPAAAILAAALAVSTASAAPPPADSVISTLDLSRPFATRTPWRFTATQGPQIDDPFGMGDKVPGLIRFCLRAGPSAPCAKDLRGQLGETGETNDFTGPHYLDSVEIVRPHGAAGEPLLLVQMSSLHSVNNNQVILTQALAYDRAQDRFTRVYEATTGHNNNQETRYVAAGPLKGAIISVSPTDNAPFGFWVSVNTPTTDNAYRQVLRYRSATRYGDGNPLAVIDSEMPNIQRRLGLWKPGAALPLPSGACPRPHLTRMELWCS